MALFDFVKEAGEKIFEIFSSLGEKADLEAARRLKVVVIDLGLRAEGLKVGFSKGTATVSGLAPTQEEKEKILLAIGNTQGVAIVDDHLQVVKSEPESTFYRVREGDTLSNISREFYGDPNKHMLIFEANQPVLKDPNRLFPGQTLRIPPLH